MTYDALSADGAKASAPCAVLPGRRPRAVVGAPAIGQLHGERRKTANVPELPFSNSTRTAAVLPHSTDSGQFSIVSLSFAQAASDNASILYGADTVRALSPSATFWWQYAASIRRALGQPWWAEEGFVDQLIVQIEHSGRGLWTGRPARECTGSPLTHRPQRSAALVGQSPPDPAAREGGARRSSTAGAPRPRRSSRAGRDRRVTEHHGRPDRHRFESTAGLGKHQMVLADDQFWSRSAVASDGSEDVDGRFKRAHACCTASRWVPGPA